MVVRKPDWPPLAAWMDHIPQCIRCARGVLWEDWKLMCSDGLQLRARAKEKTRWSIGR